VLGQQPKVLEEYLQAIEQSGRAKEAAENQQIIEDLRRKLEGMRAGATSQRETEVARHLLALQELQNDRCPRCDAVFVDKEEGDCFAVRCANPVCRGADTRDGGATKFCGWCLHDCGTSSDAAHAHVRRCPKSLNPGNFFGRPGDWERARERRRRERTEAYLADELGGADHADLRAEVLREGRAWLPASAPAAPLGGTFPLTLGWGSGREVAWSPAGDRVAVACSSGYAILLDAATGEVVRALEGHGGWVTSVAWSPDGRRVATGSRDNTARIWDAVTGTVATPVAEH
jgi:hypothetical protein